MNTFINNLLQVLAALVFIGTLCFISYQEGLKAFKPERSLCDRTRVISETVYETRVVCTYAEARPMQKKRIQEHKK